MVKKISFGEIFFLVKKINLSCKMLIVIFFLINQLIQRTPLNTRNLAKVWDNHELAMFRLCPNSWGKNDTKRLYTLFRHFSTLLEDKPPEY